MHNSQQFINYTPFSQTFEVTVIVLVFSSVFHPENGRMSCILTIPIASHRGTPATNPRDVPSAFHRVPPFRETQLLLEIPKGARFIAQ